MRKSIALFSAKHFHTQRKVALLALVIILLIPIIGYSLRLKSGAVSPFVTKSGSNLMVRGSRLRLTGYNWHWTGTNCAAPNTTEIDTTFAQIKIASHGNVVRTAFYQGGSKGGNYTAFDHYIAYAKKYGLYIVPILVNHWTSCEPSTATKTSSWYQSGYTQTSDGYPLSFKNYAVKLAKHYANEPTIAFWQLVNEPDTDTCGSDGAHILRTFADAMTTAIKAVDPHHMVDLGVPGGCAGDTITDYTSIVSGKVDLCDIWHDYQQVTTALLSDLQQRMQVCQQLKKPSFVGESGIEADITANGSQSGTITAASLKQRANFFDAKLNAGFKAGLAGYMIWNKGSQSEQDDIGPGDPTERILAKYAL